MSSILINIPDCARPDYKSTGEGVNDQITISTHDCPVQPPAAGTPYAGALITAVIILIPLIAAIAVVRHHAQSLKPKRLEQQRLARKQELDAQVELAKAHKQCLTCGKNYEPELT